MRLSALSPAFPIDASRANGDLGLNNIVAGTGWVSIGVEEREYSILLVFLSEEEKPRR